MLSSHEDVILRCEIGDVPRSTTLFFLLISKFENTDSFALLFFFILLRWYLGERPPKSGQVLWRERRPGFDYGR
jgi:hypothetical protein